MPKNPPTDRFDELPADSHRVGAHRAENPRLRGGAVLLWASLATVALIGLGIFGTLLATGRISIAPSPTATVTVAPTAEAVLDTSYTVLVLNATPQAGLAGAMRDEIIAAGWSGDDVTAGEAGSEDFETTTIYYALPEDEGAARGLAEVLGGVPVELSQAYQPVDDEATDADESVLKQLVVVIGLDRVEAADDASTD